MTPLPAHSRTALAAGLAATLAGAVALAGPAGPMAAAGSLLAYGIGAGLLALALSRPSGERPATFGWPNAVTLLRLVLTALACGTALAALTGGRGALPEPLVWWIATLALAAIALDGLDGRLARRIGPQTAVGARFDMETDAALLLALSVIAFGLGKCGPAVLAIGLMRYAFVAAGWWRPQLNGPLPPSWRRKAVCVLQGAVLVLVVLPPVTGWIAEGLAILGLAALAWSFLVDVLYLERRSAATAGGAV